MGPPHLLRTHDQQVARYFYTPGMVNMRNVWHSFAVGEGRMFEAFLLRMVWEVFHRGYSHYARNYKTTPKSGDGKTEKSMIDHLTSVPKSVTMLR